MRYIDKNVKGPEQVDPVDLYPFGIIDQPADTDKKVGDPQTNDHGDECDNISLTHAAELRGMRERDYSVCQIIGSA